MGWAKTKVISIQALRYTLGHVLTKILLFCSSKTLSYVIYISLVENTKFNKKFLGTSFTADFNTKFGSLSTWTWHVPHKVPHKRGKQNRKERGWSRNAGYAWQKLKYKNKRSERSTWSTNADAPSSCVKGSAQPWKKETSVPTRLADHTLLLQGRRYPEARDLRWTQCVCCSSSIITCWNRRFLNAP